MRRTFSILLVVLAAFLSSCVEKMDLSEFPEVPPSTQQRVEFIPLLPEWRGFNKPQDVHVGYDELVYVADTENDRVVALDINGTVVGVSQPIRRPIAIAQDRGLDLLVAGRKDTVLGSTAISLAAVYRLRLYPVQHQLSLAVPEPVIVHPLYILGKSTLVGDSAVSFTGIATLSTNEYYVTRKGPSNSSIIQPGGPDNNVLRFSSGDSLLSPLTSYLTATGTGVASANQISGITTYAVPPQRNDVDTRKSFVVTLTGDNSFRVQGMLYFEGREDAGYVPEPAFTTIDTTVASRFLYDDTPGDGLLGGGFVEPQDVTYAADNRYLFVVDAGRDSVYQFTSTGFEGVRPPAQSGQRKNIIVSFGGTGDGPTQFRRPHGVAYYQEFKTLLIADTGNDRILRFKLSTDIQ